MERMENEKMAKRVYESDIRGVGRVERQENNGWIVLRRYLKERDLTSRMQKLPYVIGVHGARYSGMVYDVPLMSLQHGI